MVDPREYIDASKCVVGVHRAMTFDEYAAIPAVSRTLLVETLRSPTHALHWLQNSRESTPAMDLGRAAHTLVLEPELFADSYAVAPDVDRRTKEGRAAWAEFIEGAGDKQIVSHADMVVIEHISASIGAHPHANRLCRSNHRETSLVWIDPLTKLPCKARVDIAVGSELADLKTTADASYEPFARSIWNYRYDMQAAFYCWGASTITGKGFDFSMIACEKTPPYAVGVYALDAHATKAGAADCRAALDTIASCLKDNNWPGYTSMDIGLPEWAARRYDHVGTGLGETA